MSIRAVWLLAAGFLWRCFPAEMGNVNMLWIVMVIFWKVLLRTDKWHVASKTITLGSRKSQISLDSFMNEGKLLIFYTI